MNTQLQPTNKNSEETLNDDFGIFHWIAWIGGLAIAIIFGVLAMIGPLEIMQLIPSLFVLFVLIISWQNDIYGFLGFLILGITVTIFFSTYKEMLNFLLISLPMFLVSAIYLKSYFDRKNKTSRI